MELNSHGVNKVIKAHILNEQRKHQMMVHPLGGNI
nr:MAG TPA: hypothetical protein [Caudoviricetes sp.]